MLVVAAEEEEIEVVVCSSDLIDIRSIVAVVWTVFLLINGESGSTFSLLTTDTGFIDRKFSFIVTNFSSVEQKVLFFVSHCIVSVVFFSDIVIVSLTSVWGVCLITVLKNRLFVPNLFV